MNRFFIDPQCITKNSIQTHDAALVHQLQRVLRMRPGDQCIFLDNTGFEFLAKITRISEKELEAEILEKRRNEAEPALFVTLYQALPKKMELFEWALQKGTEIGVSEFVPLITERTERQSISKPERLLKILKEAAEQCERGKIPKLAPIQKFSEALTHSTGRQKILLHGRGDYPYLSSVIAHPLRGYPMNQSSFDIFIGPEGGFTKGEIQQAEKNGFLIVSLGPRVLRTETAGIVAASLVL